MSPHPSLLFSFLFLPHLLHPIASNAQKQNLENLTLDWESEDCCITNLGLVVWFPLCFGDYDTLTPLWNAFSRSNERDYTCVPYTHFFKVRRSISENNSHHQSSITSPLFSETFHSPPSLAQTINMETTGSAGEIQWEAQYHSPVQGRQKNTQLVALV